MRSGMKSIDVRSPLVRRFRRSRGSARRASRMTRWVRRLALAMAVCSLLGLQGIQTVQAQAPLPNVGSSPAAIGMWANPVQHVAATDIVPHVREVLAGAGLPAEVLADRGQNAIVIQGSEAAQRLAAQAIAAVDRPAVAGPVAEPPVLMTYPVAPERLQAVATALQLELGRGRSNVRITADQRTGQLLVMAPRAVQVQVAAALQALAQEAAAIQQTSAFAGGEVRQGFRLQRSNWKQFEDALQHLGGGRLAVTTHRNGELAEFQLVGYSGGRSTIEVDRRANAVTIVAPPPLIGGWEKVIYNLENGPRDASESVELIRLVNAEPARVQRAFGLLQQASRNAVTAAAFRMPQAPSRNGQFVNQQQPPADGQEPTVEEMLLLEQAEAAARALAEAQQQQQQPPEAGAEAGDESGLFGNVQIEFVPELGVIVVRGSKRDVQRVMDVIKQIEEQSTVTQPEVEVLVLQNANSNAVAEVVNELYEQVLAPRQGQVSISALDNPNALLLIGRREAVMGVIELVKKLDIPAQPDAQLRVLRLKHASALNAEELVRQFFVDRPGTNTDPRPGLGTRARVVADYRTNSLIVSASPRDLAEVARLVEQIDVESIPAENELRVFKLRNALATDLQSVLQAAITGESGGSGGGGGGGPGGQAAVQGGLADASGGRVTPPSTRLSILSVDEQGNRVIDSGILAGVIVAADPNVNALIVRAPSASMSLVAELIRQLDSAPGAESAIKVFEVENGDATSLTATLQELFGLAVTAGQGNTGGLFGFNQAAQFGAVTGGDESSLIPLRFSVDVRTNSIIATGSQSDLEVVETLLTRLDTEGFSTRNTEVIWLHNASALDVAAALQDFVQQQIQQFQNNALFNQQLGPFEQLERNVVVVAEPVTNSLVISVSPRFYDSIRRVIDQLDRRPPMVLIKVLLAEVTLRDGFELGGEFGIQDSVLFDRGVANPGDPASNPGFNFIPGLGTPNSNTSSQRTVAAQGATSFLLNRASEIFDYGGFVFSAASDSVNVLLRMLQDSGRLEILAAPKIMTLDNTEGFVQVGSVVPRPTGVSNTQNGTVVTTTDTDVGLILRVQPRVGPDGLIQMNVDATRSRVGPEEEGIPIGFSTVNTGGIGGAQSEVIRSPQIETTRAQSVISAYDGQTVVYGGLITKERQQNSRRVPWLSDIPILGIFFRYDREIEQRTELLVVLTPMLVTSESDLEEIKLAESSRMSWCLAEVLEMYGNYGLSPGHGLWGPAVAPVIYPDLAPTVDDATMHLNPENLFPPSGDGSGAGPVYMENGEVIYPEGTLPMPVEGGWPYDPNSRIPKYPEGGHPRRPYGSTSTIAPDYPQQYPNQWNPDSSFPNPNVPHGATADPYGQPPVITEPLPQGYQPTPPGTYPDNRGAILEPAVVNPVTGQVDGIPPSNFVPVPPAPDPRLQPAR